MLFPRGNNIHICNFRHYLSLPQPPYPRFPLKNGILLPYRFLKPIRGSYFFHIWMYPAGNPPHQITTLGGVLLLTASHILSHILKFTGSPPPTSWCACTSLRSVVFFSFVNLILPKPRYMLQWVPTWNRNGLGMPRSLLLSWRTIPDLASRFTCFLIFWVTPTYKRENEMGASNIGNFRNKNKHNISPMVILLPPVSLAFPSASEYLNSPSSTVSHSLYFQFRNPISASSTP